MKHDVLNNKDENFNDTKKQLFELSFQFCM
jgi:hypothetical protein